MFKDKVMLHQYVLFAVLIFLLLLKVLTGNFVFNLSLLWWLLGAIVGFVFVFSDKLVYGFTMNPEDTLKTKLKDLFGENTLVSGLVALLNEKHEQKEMVMRSFLFLVVWLVMALLTVTSVSSPFARGFVLGIGIHVYFDLIYDYFWNRFKFDLWFWQIKREMTGEEKRWFLILSSTFFVLLAINF